MCKILTYYESASPEKIKGIWSRRGGQDEPLTQIGFYDFGELHFDVYEGKGGHLAG